MGKFQTQINYLSVLGHLLGADVFAYIYTTKPPPTPTTAILFACSGVSNVEVKGSTV